jgi:hypothetical protein
MGVAARRYAWSDPDVRQLSRRFIPVADDILRLQRSGKADSDFFLKALQDQRLTAQQGVYVLTGGGQVLLVERSLDPHQLLLGLQQALEDFGALDPEERVPDAELGAELAENWRWQDAYPADGLVLLVETRDLPAEEAQGSEPRSWNRDTLWLQNAEMRTLVPQPATVGATVQVPTSLVQRLVRFHLLDFVKNLSHSFARSEVRQAQWTSTVTARHGSRVELEFRGQTEASIPGRRGLQATLRGSATFDLKQQQFRDFELLARGTRFGMAQGERSREEWAPAPIGLLLTLAPASLRVPPRFIDAYGRRPEPR